MKPAYLGFALGLIAIVTLSLASRLGETQPAAASDNLRPHEHLIARQAVIESTSKSGSQAQNAAIARQINQLIDAGPFVSARWGIHVVSLSSGSTLYERNAKQPFTPASNMKLYTTGVALDFLGADYKWRTSVYALSLPNAAGVIEGDLILYGRGAPDLVSQSARGNENSIARLVDALQARGITRIQGNVIGDDSYFRGNAVGDGWQWNDIQWYFGAEASALSVNGNEVDVNLLPPTKADSQPEVKASDTLGYVEIENRLAAGNRADRSTIGLHRGLSNNRVEVWGEFAPGAKGFGVRLSVHNPALWAAKIFLNALKTKGITVDGQAISRTSRSAPNQRFEPAAANELAFVVSEPLSQIARVTNKDSNNLYAELLLRTLGRERRQMLAEPEPSGRERGDEEAGTALIRMWLERHGVHTQTLALHDGSGLSRLNLVTPEATTRLLVSISQSGTTQVFRDSLPIAGTDGTLAGRLRTVSGKAFAKTGSLIYDNSLSGYLINAQGEILAFSIFCNDYTGGDNSARLIDQIVLVLASDPDSRPISGQKSQ